MNCRVALALTAFVVSSVGPAFAAPSAQHEVSLFAVTKSQNKNRVVYALGLSDQCSPASASPVRPYWRMLERGAGVTEPLLDRERGAYGVHHQNVTQDRVKLALNALPGREIVVVTSRAGDACAASASLLMGSTWARLLSVHVVLAWPFGVDRLVIRGQLPDGRVLEEIVHP
jgi:hypothetical protein